MSSAPRAPSSSYAAAGVDIDAQDRALRRIKKIAKGTFTPGVLSEIGGFGGLFRPALTGLDEPVLVASADGVGTKLAVARLVGDFSTVGRDLVNHCVNDILVQGARPLFFLDYVGAGSLDPETLVTLVEGVAAGCKENGCALLGGETAEMPGFYPAGDYELVGFIVGLVERQHLLDGTRVAAGDLLVALPSSGLHTNGYSLVRRIVLEQAGLTVEDPAPWLPRKAKRTIGQELLSVHRSYLEWVSPLLGRPGLHGLVHVTGGGLTDNLPRLLPAGTQAEVRLGAWEVPEIFHWLQEAGEIETEEMLRVFNMGIGMVAIAAATDLGDILARLRAVGCRAAVIGSVQEGRGGVIYDLGSREGVEGEGGAG
jgi:phosphoribosylformylglycinamidine cyclo-ligase